LLRSPASTAAINRPTPTSSARDETKRADALGMPQVRPLDQVRRRIAIGPCGAGTGRSMWWREIDPFRVHGARWPERYASWPTTISAQCGDRADFRSQSDLRGRARNTASSSERQAQFTRCGISPGFFALVSFYVAAQRPLRSVRSQRKPNPRGFRAAGAPAWEVDVRGAFLSAYDAAAARAKLYWPEASARRASGPSGSIRNGEGPVRIALRARQIVPWLGRIPCKVILNLGRP